MNIIDGNLIKEEMEKELKYKIDNIDTKLKLVIFSVGNDPASNVYINNKEKLCNRLGIDFELKKYDKTTTSDLVKEIEICNDDKSVTGILVQLPLPSNIDENIVINSINPNKDVDGLTSVNMGKLMNKEKSLVPCTALGIIKMLEYKSINLEGLNVVIIGRSKLVGLPLIPLFLQKNATVTSCNSRTKNLKEITKKADILVVAIGKKCFINEDYINSNQIIIDVGINRENGKLYGDVNFDEVKDKVKYITPVPGGVGKLTLISLINNIIKSYYLQN